MIDNDVDIFLGLDVGKTHHYACALNRQGDVVLARPLPNDEAKLVTLYHELQRHGRVLVVVDQPATIGALAVAVAQHLSIAVGYLPGLKMRRLADLHPGKAKTDAKDAYIIAHSALRLPQTLRALSIDEETEAALVMLTGFDLDLARQINQVANRIRGLFTQFHPALEAVIGPRLEHDAILEVLAYWPTPTQLAKAGRGRIAAKLKKHGARRHQAWADDICQALKKQHVVVTGTDAAAHVLPHLARQLIQLHEQRNDVATQVEALVADHPLCPVLTSMPGVGIKTAAIFIAETSGKHFANAAALASYAGLTPNTRQSGSSIRSETVNHAGNKRLKRALFLSAFSVMSKDPESAIYYQRKRAQGKRHNQAIIALAHRRVTVLYAMLRDGTYYQPTQPRAA